MNIDKRYKRSKPEYDSCSEEKRRTFNRSKILNRTSNESSSQEKFDMEEIKEMIQEIEAEILLLFTVHTEIKQDQFE